MGGRATALRQQQQLSERLDKPQDEPESVVEGGAEERRSQKEAPKEDGSKSDLSKSVFSRGTADEWRRWEGEFGEDEEEQMLRMVEELMEGEMDPFEGEMDEEEEEEEGEGEMETDDIIDVENSPAEAKPPAAVDPWAAGGGAGREAGGRGREEEEGEAVLLEDEVWRESGSGGGDSDEFEVEEEFEVVEVSDHRGEGEEEGGEQEVDGESRPRDGGEEEGGGQEVEGESEPRGESEEVYLEELPFMEELELLSGADLAEAARRIIMSEVPVTDSAFSLYTNAEGVEEVIITPLWLRSFVEACPVPYSKMKGLKAEDYVNILILSLCQPGAFLPLPTWVRGILIDGADTLPQLTHKDLEALLECLATHPNLDLEPGWVSRMFDAVRVAVEGATSLESACGLVQESIVLGGYPPEGNMVALETLLKERCGSEELEVATLVAVGSLTATMSGMGWELQDPDAATTISKCVAEAAEKLVDQFLAEENGQPVPRKTAEQRSLID
eukprot:gene15555-21647_t